MKLVYSEKVRPVQASPEIAMLLESVAEKQLQEWVERISVPRHFEAEPEQNRATADWLCDVFKSMGYRVERQGRFANILALPEALGRMVSGLTSAATKPEVILVGAHYDSVPGCPGADDNGSAVAAMLGCAAACSQWKPPLPVVFVAFNREEDSLLGSREFVASYHKPTDTPDTLDYAFLRRVTQLLTASVTGRAQEVLKREG